MFDLMTEDRVTIDMLESDILYESMYKDMVLSMVTEAPEEGVSRFKKFVDSVVDFITKTFEKIQENLYEFFSDKKALADIKKINEIVKQSQKKIVKQSQKTRTGTAITVASTSIYANQYVVSNFHLKRFTIIDITRLNLLNKKYLMKMKFNKGKSRKLYEEYVAERKALLDKGASISVSIFIFLNLFTNEYDRCIRELKSAKNTHVQNVNEILNKIDESDTEKKKMYTEYLNYSRSLLNYTVRDYRLVISSFRYSLERATKMGSLDMKLSNNGRSTL